MEIIFNYTIDPKLIDEYNPPEDLKELLARTKNIIRGQDPRYPKGFISDNVYVHTLRCIWVAREFFGDISDLDHPKIERTLLIHDLPEIVVGDAPSPAVKDGIVEKPEDIEVARKMLSPSDFELYLEFEKASDYIKRKTDDIPGINALVAKVIDNVEGNLMFHAYLFKFRDDTRIDQVPETALTYPFDQLPKHLDRLKLLPDSETRQRLIEFYEYQQVYVSNLWNKFPDKLPASIREHLDNL